MWIKDNITRTGKDVWYEAELVKKIKAECQDKLTQNFDVTGVTKRILDLIQENEV